VIPGEIFPVEVRSAGQKTSTPPYVVLMHAFLSIMCSFMYATFIYYMHLLQLNTCIQSSTRSRRSHASRPHNEPRLLERLTNPRLHINEANIRHAGITPADQKRHTILNL
jgi:hypothetical protein